MSAETVEKFGEAPEWSLSVGVLEMGVLVVMATATGYTRAVLTPRSARDLAALIVWSADLIDPPPATT